MANLIMVDNSSYVFGLNIENGVPVIPFYDSASDTHLAQLLPYLLCLVSLDVRATNRSRFRLSQMIQCGSLSSAINSLFH